MKKVDQCDELLVNYNILIVVVNNFIRDCVFFAYNNKCNILWEFIYAVPSFLRVSVRWLFLFDCVSEKSKTK